MNQGQSGQDMSEQDLALYDFMLEQAGAQPEMQDIARRRAMIDQLRGQSQVPTEARQTARAGGGAIVTARSPLEMLAPALGQGLASYKEAGVDAAAKALQDKRIQGLQGVRSRMFGGSKGSAFPMQPMPGEDTQPF